MDDGKINADRPVSSSERVSHDQYRNGKTLYV